MTWLFACAGLLLAGCGRGRFVELPDAAPLDYQATVLADRPLAYWRLGEPALGTAHDDLGGDDGQYVGTCVFGVPGATSADSAVSFDGSTCKVILGTRYAFVGTAAFSLEAWVSVGPGGPAFRNIVGAQTRSAQNPIDGYALVVGTTGVEIERAIAMSNVKTPGVAIPSGQFVHVVTTYDGMTLRTFVDGALVGAMADTRPMPAYSTNEIIGASVAGNYFPGSIDEVAIYDVALTPEQIQEHHDAALR